MSAARMAQKPFTKVTLPKSRMSTNSIMPADMSGRVTCRYFIQNKKEEFEKCEIADLYLRINCLAVWKALDKKLLVKSYAKNLH